ncbi:MAG TPA: hypothetical protein VJ963_08155 [Bacteroidales bacterium]|nr:hypothetical protein [Bacteroidales bacterium]
MFPESFRKRLRLQSYIDSGELLSSLEQSSPVSIRINPGKWSAKPAVSSPVSWCETGYYLPYRPVYTLDPLFHSGCYYPQEASGMFLKQAYIKATEGRVGLRILDLCGAPGGKSTLISEMAGRGSLLVANEVIRARAAILSETITRWGAINTIVTQNDPSVFARMPGYFDIVVADAPCSGEGMFRNPVAIKEWSQENAALCSERQKRILMDVWPALKENGILIYSTCTFNPAENEENIKWLAGNHNIESLRLNINRFEGIAEITYKGIYGYGFHPGKIKGEGFFISVVRKHEKESNTERFPRLRPEYRPGKKDIDTMEKWTNYSGSNILKKGDELYGLPCSTNEYALLFSNLKVIRPGTRLAALRKDDYIPAHELALSQALRKNVFPSAETGYNTALAYLGRDNFTVTVPEKGWNLLTYRDINLGFVKNIGNRLNNYYPVDWRIRMNHEGSSEASLIQWEEPAV